MANCLRNLSNLELLIKQSAAVGSLVDLSQLSELSFSELRSRCIYTDCCSYFLDLFTSTSNYNFFPTYFLVYFLVYFLYSISIFFLLSHNHFKFYTTYFFLFLLHFSLLTYLSLSIP